MHRLQPPQLHRSRSARRDLLAGFAAALLLVLAAACGPERRPPPPATAPVVAAPGAATGPRYTIDPARSEIRILVYRSGPLARFGHNHVLLAHSVTGSVRLPAPGVYAGAEFELSFPVESLLVDDSEARRAEGAEFDGIPSANDIAGTRGNLLGPKVLDAAEYPRITVSGTTVAAPGGLGAHATATVKGVASDLDAVLEYHEAGGTLTVRGGTGTTHARLGLTPFGAALGALTVREDIELRFTLIAVAGS
jgi:polyisoprenoid-binding protein YceI